MTRNLFNEILATGRKEIAAASTFEARHEAFDRALVAMLSANGCPIADAYLVRRCDRNAPVEFGIECETEIEAVAAREWFERAGVNKFTRIAFDSDLGWTFTATASRPHAL